MPAVLNPLACLFLNSVTVAMGLSPAFSANVDGMTSKESAKALRMFLNEKSCDKEFKFYYLMQ